TGGRKRHTALISEGGDALEQVAQGGERPELRVVLLGRSGAGRSATGNTLLCQELFESRLASQPVTTTCAKGRRDWGEWSVVVMDTPAIVGGSQWDKQQLAKERDNCRSFAAHEHCVLLLVTQLGRYTREDREVRLRSARPSAPLRAGRPLPAERYQPPAGTARPIQLRPRGPTHKRRPRSGASRAPFRQKGKSRKLVTEQPPHFLRARRNEGPRELRLVLVGKSGGGRSATGNSIVGTAAFESRLATAAVTQRSSMQSVTLKGYDVHVVDTPDAFDSPERSARCCREIARCALLSAPGPHALLLVTQLGRFTQEDEAAVQQVWRLFGSGAAGRTVVVFTRGDELRGGSLLRYVQDTGTYALQKLLRDCGQRCCAFDNRATGKQKEEQVGELLAIVLEMLGGDLNNYYRNGLYDRAEQLMERPDIDFEKKCDLLAEDVEKQLELEHVGLGWLQLQPLLLLHSPLELRKSLCSAPQLGSMFSSELTQQAEIESESNGAASCGVSQRPG
uniref:AIG1-type G domain-containing protein n=1 Tax=Coturnix japonica TaxID=93934 RepID=A0A8C2Y8W9_COTJA